MSRKYPRYDGGGTCSSAHAGTMRAPMKGFSKQDFEVIEPLQRDELCRQLAAVLSSRLEAATNFEDEIASIIDDLRKVGHDLWSFDEDIGHQFWGRNYAKPSPPGLLIEFRAPHDVVVMWDTK